MKGLLLKDLCCLKDQLKFFLCVSFGTIYVCLLFILSAKQGNIALAMKSMEFAKADGGFITLMYDVVVIALLATPIALAERVNECFVQDYKVSFAKVFYTIPVSDSIKIGSRYIITLIYIAVATSISLFAGILVSVSSGMYTITQMFCIVTFLSVCMLIFMSFVLCGNYFFGGKRSSLISTLLFVFLFGGFYVLAVTKSLSMEESAAENFVVSIVNKLNWYLNNPGKEIIIFAGIGILLFGISYTMSVMCLKRKNGQL